MATMQVAARRPVRKRNWIWRDVGLFTIFAGPNFLLLAVFSFWPLFYNAYLSMISWDMVAVTKPFVGLENYVNLFTDRRFGLIMLNTAVFAIGSVVCTLILGLALALLLNQRIHFRQAARTILFAPVVVSGAAIAVVWSYIFDPAYGLMRPIFVLLNLPVPHWLTDTSLALPAVIIVYVWKNVGYALVIYLAGLQAIPLALLEAATIDGAGAARRTWQIVIPLLSPTTFFLSVTSVLAVLQAFDIIQVLTAGGPVKATTTLIYDLYDQGFVAFDAGRAGADAMLLFGIMLVLTILQMRYVERRVTY